MPCVKGGMGKEEGFINARTCDKTLKKRIKGARRGAARAADLKRAELSGDLRKEKTTSTHRLPSHSEYHHCPEKQKIKCLCPLACSWLHQLYSRNTGTAFLRQALCDL